MTVGTLFHKTHVDLQKWFHAIRLVLRDDSQISVRSLSKEIGVSKNTAHYMLARIRAEMTEDIDLLQRIAYLGDSENSDSRS